MGLVPGLALVAGAASSLIGDASVTAAFWKLLPVFALALVSWRLRQTRLCVLYLVVGFFACGVLLTAHAREAALHTSLRAALEHEFGSYLIETHGPGVPHDPVRIRAVVQEDASADAGFVSIRVAVQEIELRGAWRPADGGVTLSVSGATAPGGMTEWVAGRRIEAPVTFRRPARYENDGVPDFERDLALDGTTLFGSVKSSLLVQVVGHGNRAQELAARIRRHVRVAVNRWVAAHDPLAAAVVTAVLIGDRGALPQDARRRLQDAGTYHVIAISGGNIAILTMAVLGLLRLAGISGRLAAALALAVLVAYACIVTAGPSVWRATLMAGAYLVARTVDHRMPVWHAMGMAAAAAVCMRPLDVRDPGFILTFGATAALLECARLTMLSSVRRGSRRPSGLRGSSTPAPWIRWIMMSLLASLAVEIVLMPVSAWTFGRVTSAGLILNLLAVPLMGVVQIAGMVVTGFDAIGVVAAPAGWLAYIGARWIVGSAGLVDVAPWLAGRVPPPSLVLLMVYYLALAATLLFRGRVRIGAAAALVLTAFAIVGGASLPAGPSAPANALRLTMLDVGQADASLVEFPDGTAILVDTGGIPFGSGRFDIGERVVTPALWARGIRRLHAVLLTHGDPDHAGGAQAVLPVFAPRELWQGVPVPGHSGLRELDAAAAAAGVAAVTRLAGDQAVFGGARVRVLHPPAPDWERQRVRNDDSVVIEIVYGDVALLMAGDISASVEREIVPQLTPARLRILKVPHHGSRTSSSTELLEGWRPQIALVSCGRGNTFGHPARDVLERLQAAGATVYRTDQHGQITVTTDGKRVDVDWFNRIRTPSR